MVLIALGVVAFFYPVPYLYQKSLSNTSKEGLFMHFIFTLIAVGLAMCGLFTPTNEYESTWTEVERIQLLQMSQKSDSDYFKVSGDNLVYKTSDLKSESTENPPTFKLETISLSDTTFVIDNSITKPYIVKNEKKMLKNIFSYCLYGPSKIMYTVYIPEQYGITTE